MVGVGPKWVLVQATRDGGYFDGWVACRTTDVAKVRVDDSFEGKFGRTLPDWPPAPPADLDLTSTKRLIRSLSSVVSIVGIEQERRRRGCQWIGVPVGVDRGWLGLREVRPDATWEDQPVGYRLRQITKVEVANAYQVALAQMAGEPPEQEQ